MIAFLLLIHFQANSVIGFDYYLCFDCADRCGALLLLEKIVDLKMYVPLSVEVCDMLAAVVFC
jgi:hypothetical protein